MQARPLAPCVHTRMHTNTHTLVLVHHGPRMRAPLRPPPAHQILCPPRPGRTPWSWGPAGPAGTQWTPNGLGDRAWAVAPMGGAGSGGRGSTQWTWGTSWTVAPTCDGGGAGPIQIARVPLRRGGAICDSGATMAFMTTTANVDDHPSHPHAQFLRPSSCKEDRDDLSAGVLYDLFFLTTAQALLNLDHRPTIVVG